MEKVSSDSILRQSLKGLNDEKNMLQANAAELSNPNSVKKTTLTVATPFGPKKVIQEVVDETLIWNSRQTFLSAVGLSVKVNACESIEAQLGEDGSASTFSHFATKMATQFHDLASVDRVGLAGAQMTTVSDIKMFLSQTSSFSEAVQATRRDADSTIQSALEKINNCFTQISDNNLRIITSQKGDFSGIEGVRAALNELAQYIDVYARQETDGTYTVYSDRGGAQILVKGGEAGTFNYTSPPGVDPTTSFSPITVTYQGLASADLTPIFLNSKGSIGAGLYVRDILTPSVQKQMDQATSALYKQFNAIHNLGTSNVLRPQLTGSGIPTQTSVLGTELLDPSQVSGTVRFGLIDSDLKFAAVGGGQVNFKDINLSGFNASLMGAPATLTKFVDFLNTEFGATLGITASINNNQVSLTATDANFGISIGERDPTGDPPVVSQLTLASGEKGAFSEFFGLNNLFTSSILPGSDGFSQKLSLRADIEQSGGLCLGALTMDTPRKNLALFGTHIAEKLHSSWFYDTKGFNASTTLISRGTSLDEYFKLIIKNHENMTKLFKTEKKFADSAHIEAGKIVQKYSKASAKEIEMSLTELAIFQKFILQFMTTSMSMQKALSEAMRG